MKLFVKICGLANAADVTAVTDLRPDALGFVFWPRSPRAVTPEQVAVWTRALPPGLLKVGVFVDPALEDIRRAVDLARLDVVQWHGFPAGGNSAADFIQALRQALAGVVQARPSVVGGASATLRSGEAPALRSTSSPARGTGSPAHNESIRGAGSPAHEGSPARTIKVWQVVHLGHESASVRCVDAVVLDSYSPAAPGGTGHTVDWTAARAFVAASRTRVLLAGGLRAENVAAAIRAVRPWGVDVSSGVEAQPGRKHLDAVKRFIEACRAE